MESLQDRLIRHEGLKLFPYMDSLEKRTIGAGHLITAQDGDKYDKGITTEQAISLLEDDIRKAVFSVKNTLPWAFPPTLDECRSGILIEMCFQLGITGLLQFKKMISACKTGDYMNAAQEMIGSVWHRQTPSRCEELANLMLNGYNE